MRIKILLVASGICSLFASCDESVPLPEQGEGHMSPEVKIEYKQLVPLEDALTALDSFISSLGDASTLNTRGGVKKSIASVDKYYASAPATRSEDTLPDAYIINFSGMEGFALLGANTAMPDILAVTENGNIDPFDLSVILPEDYAGPGDDGPGGDVPAGFDPENFDTYCEEDGDYYSTYELQDSEVKFLQDNLRRMLQTASANDVERYVGGCYPGGIGGGAGGSGSGLTGEDSEDETTPAESARYNECRPLLSYSWGQREPFNRYCYVDTYKHALTGCSNTALSMIITYNEFPTELVIDSELLDWKGMQSSVCSDAAFSVHEMHIALLMGYIFNNYPHVAWNWCLGKFTLITPEQMKKCLQNLGYENVVKISADHFSDEMIQAVSNMLGEGKPVFISAMPSSSLNGHSWVIDGAVYTTEGSYLVHCNYGWRACCNGYFNYDLMNPTRAVSYDDFSKDNTNDYYNEEYSYHFRMLTYDIPNGARRQEVVIDY